MNTFNRKVSNFPTENNLYHVDIIELYKQGKLDELNNFVVCRDQDDNVTATFGQERWNLMPFARNDAKNSLDFSNFIDTPRLKNELKILAYGVLFSKGNLARKPLAFSTVHGKLGCLKDIYHFLKINNLESIQSLSISANMLKLEHYLFNGDYKQTTISQKLTSLNAVLKLRTWHNLQVNFKPLNSRVSARKLGHGESQQLLVIPERLNNEIYGKAIELVENALPHANLIAEIERELQDNYMEGKRIVEEKLEKKRFAFSNANGDVINTHKFSMTVYDNQPRSGASIVQTLNGLIKDIKIESAFDFNRYWSQLITACYIICGGFSGMRYSELDKLTPESYYIDTFDGRDYHLLQSHTFKLGEKRETWITAPVTKKAISLASTLTKYMRSQVVSADKKYTNSLWVNQSHRSHKPKKILKWNERLTQFCSQFNFVVTEADYQECLESNPRSTERVKHTVKVGQPWAFSTHQFRRTLAFYCIKNRLGTLVALKQQFKHLYLAMTEWYTNGGKLAGLRDLKVDTDIIYALNAINAETTANKIFKQWHSDETLSGTHGKAIMKMRGDVPTIYSSWEVIYKAVKDGKLTLHGSLHSYCKNGYECDMEGVVAPQFCVDCSAGGSIIDEQQAKWWQKKHRNLTAYMASGEDISVSERSHYITQIRAAELVMADFNIPFSAFEADLRTIAL